MQHRSTSAQFQWQRSDNSFTFNFSPEIAPSSPQSIMNLNNSNPEQADSESSSGFAFNFQIPAGTEQKSDSKLSAGDAVRSDQETSVASNPNTQRKKKKKKKELGAGGGMQTAPEKENKQREGAPKQESTELTPEQQLSRELDWCIEQLELGLRTQKSSTKQREEASRALKTLRSSKAPLIKKRQVMRAVSGDYRKKMEEDRDRQNKLMCSAMSSAKMTRVSVPRCRSMYHRNTDTDKPPAQTETSLPAEQTDGDRFVFRPSGEEFRFNFNL